MPSELEEPPLSTELEEDEATPQTDADLVTAAPEVLADSLGDYLRAQWLRVKSGESGALPIIAGLIMIIIFFQAERSSSIPPRISSTCSSRRRSTSCSGRPRYSR